MALPPQMFVTITSPAGLAAHREPHVPDPRQHLVDGAHGHVLISKSVTIQFGHRGPTVAATFTGTTLNWVCTGTVSPATPWDRW